MQGNMKEMGIEKGARKAASDGSWLWGLSEPNTPKSSLPPKRDENVMETLSAQKITTFTPKAVILLNAFTMPGSTPLLCSTWPHTALRHYLPCILSCSTSHSYQKTKPQNLHSESTTPAVRVSSVCVRRKGEEG